MIYFWLCWLFVMVLLALLEEYRLMQRWGVFDCRDNRLVREFRTLRAATNHANKLDTIYGGVRFIVRGLG